MRITTPLKFVVAALASCSVWAGTTSDFSVDDEGWSVVSLMDFGPYDSVVQGPLVPTYHSSGGNPGGYISSTDPDGLTWWFQAPAKFLGDKSSHYGSTLSFDLIQTPGGGGDWVDADVALVGAGKVLVFDAGANPPADDWTSFSVELNSGSGWKLDSLSGPSATAADLQDVLANLGALRIRGEFSFGSDVAGLDNVVLADVRKSLPDTGSTFVLLAMSACGLFRMRRHP